MKIKIKNLKIKNSFNTNYFTSHKEMEDGNVDKEISEPIPEYSNKSKWDCKSCGSLNKIKNFKLDNRTRCQYCTMDPTDPNDKNCANNNKEMWDASVDKEILKFVTKNSSMKNKWKCDKCNSIYESKFSHFNNGSRCPYCCSAPKKVNDSQWAYSNQEMYNASVDKEFLKTVTQGSNKENKWKCDKCNSIYESSFKTFNNGSRCGYCSGKKANETNWAYGNEEMKEYSVDKDILKTVTNCSSKKNKWKCDKCNSIYESRFADFHNGSRCPFCSSKKK